MIFYIRYKPIFGKPVGNPPTLIGGTGSVRVQEWLPRPVPHRTLPKTPTGFKTHDNPYV